jgi:ankyrin repeat protein
LDLPDIPRAPEIGGFGATTSPHPVCGPGSAFERNPLHKAVCEMDLAAIQIEVVSRPSEFFNRRDTAGYAPMHSACSLCMKDAQNSSIATDIVRMLISAGADASIGDSEGNTPLHWAARAGDKGTAELLLLKNCPKGRFPIQLSCSGLVFVLICLLFGL